MPALRLEPAVVVGEVDVARRGVRVPSARDGAVGLGVRPPTGFRLGDEPSPNKVSVRADPVALPAGLLARGGNIEHKPGGGDAGATFHVVGPAGVSVPPILFRRLCGHGGLLCDWGRHFSGLDGARGGVVGLSDSFCGACVR